MTDFLLSRRRLLVSAGAGVLGLTIVNTVSGCSGSEAPAASAPSGAASASMGGWERVSLSYVSAYLLIRGDEAAVVDLGTPGSGDAIGSALTAAGSGWGQVKHVILTHQHQDHVGGLPDVEPKVKATFYAGQDDVGSIVNAQQPLKPLADGDEVFGLQIVGTPGHTLGHISVFDPSTGTLVAGDALRTTEGLAGSDPQYTADLDQAAASLKKLAALDVRTILPGHGQPLTEGAADALRKLAGS
ncbi:MBL fold metallo-hydrolase [Paractinoplanes atraurantiacus]|uniref:Glyoxylase, beta-lactamase superfamily II n=1 Tax=Paractinoplanes atraurantiacus TaxID=1036182 RepID=A0A285KFV1_9ACTN|nr:MBL fold metallo-hydrolase [Actinoplanes atraurantiacus]SNY70171.1 Glyoxylase, beta-lactamase superfamily II [Actinoplanes atraurantiacus]